MLSIEEGLFWVSTITNSYHHTKHPLVHPCLYLISPEDIFSFYYFHLGLLLYIHIHPNLNLYFLPLSTYTISFLPSLPLTISAFYSSLSHSLLFLSLSLLTSPLSPIHLQAKCCDDKVHCCPHDMSCDYKEGVCHKQGLSIPLLAKLKSKQIVKKVYIYILKLLLNFCYC